MLCKGIAGDTSALVGNPFHQRVFPDYPALIAVIHLAGLNWKSAALIVNWVSVGIVPILASKLFSDRRLGWATVVLTPSYLTFSAVVMSEPCLLLFTMLGLTALKAGLDRHSRFGTRICWDDPSNGLLCGLGRNGLASHPAKALNVILLGGVAASVVGAGLALLHWSMGDAFLNLHRYQEAYARELFGWPFESLMMTPIRSEVAIWKVIYVWGHVLIALFACFLLWRRWLAPQGSRDDRGLLVLAAVWLSGNTLFSLFVGHISGFHEFHRFILPALPALLLAYQPTLPYAPPYWLLIFIPSFAMALFGLVH